MTQKKLMLVTEHGDGSSWWRIACDCGSKDHDCELLFEKDSDGLLSLTLYKDVYNGDWQSTDRGFFSKLWWRIKVATRVLFTGYIEMTGDIVLDHGGIEAMQTAIQEVIDGRH